MAFLFSRTSCTNASVISVTFEARHPDTRCLRCFPMMYIIRSSHRKIWVQRKMSILFGLKFASVIAPGEAFFRFLCQFLILIYYWHFSRDV